MDQQDLEPTADAAEEEDAGADLGHAYQVGIWGPCARALKIRGREERGSTKGGAVGSWQAAFGDEEFLPTEVANIEGKRQVAQQMALRLRDGDVVGVGSGTTSLLAIQALGERAARERLRWVAVPTSLEAALAGSAAGAVVTSLELVRPDWSFDGADEVDPEANLLKGHGGAMLREKLVMASSPERYVLVDQSKLVDRLGARTPVPIEVLPEALRLVRDALLRLGAVEVHLRPGGTKGGPMITEHGNCVLDVRLPEIQPDTEQTLKALPGVVESGLFLGYRPTVLTPGNVGPHA